MEFLSYLCSRFGKGFLPPAELAGTRAGVWVCVKPPAELAGTGAGVWGFCVKQQAELADMWGCGGGFCVCRAVFWGCF